MRELKGIIDSCLKSVEGVQGYVVRDLSVRREIASNQYERFNAAGIIKLSYLYTALLQVQEGIHSLDGIFALRADDVVGGDGVLKILHEGLQLTLLDLLNLMIGVSDNTATNILYDILGKEAMNRALAEIGVDDTHVARKFMKVVPGLVNTTTPHDAALLIENFVDSRVLEEPYRSVGLNILLNQQVNTKLSADLLLCRYCGGLMAEDNLCTICEKRDMAPELVWFAHKTGEISTATHNVGIMQVRDKRIVVSLMMQEITNMKQAIEAHRQIGKAVYKFFDQQGEGL